MPLKTHQDELPALNLTPMIDVVFLLIIFFMVGAKFADERDIKLHVPAVGQASPNQNLGERRVINVMRDGRILLNDNEVTLTELTNQLQTERQHASQLSVAVRGDADGAFQNVASVLSACRAAGIGDMAISVRITRR
jgi:biopolymer transport protein ExbD